MFYYISAKCLWSKYVTIFAQSIRTQDAQLYARFYAAKCVLGSEGTSQIPAAYSRFIHNSLPYWTNQINSLYSLLINTQRIFKCLDSTLNPIWPGCLSPPFLSEALERDWNFTTTNQHNNWMWWNIDKWTPALNIRCTTLRLPSDQSKLLVPISALQSVPTESEKKKKENRQERQLEFWEGQALIWFKMTPLFFPPLF